MANDGEYGNIMFPFAIKGGVAASGYPKKPTAPTSLSVNVNTTFGSAILSWTAPVNTGFPVITSYTVEVVGVTTINTGNTNTSYTWTGGTKGTSYQFRVYANNSAGQGAASNTAGPSIIQGNVATGGSISDIANYNGTGQTWRVHTLSSNGTISFSVSNNASRVFIHGAGGNPGGDVTSGGGGGGMIWNDSVTLSTGSYSFTTSTSNSATCSVSGPITASVTNGSAVNRNAGRGPAGTATSVPSGWSSSSGGTGGASSKFDGDTPTNGDGGMASTITGSSLGYCGGGGGGAWRSPGAIINGGSGVNGGGTGGTSNGQNPAPAGNNGQPGARGGGGGGAPVYGNGGAGGSPEFIVSYRLT